MVAYADSSFIVSLLTEDRNSEAAKRHVIRYPGAISVTSFSKYEIEHALRTLAFKKQISREEMHRSLLRFERDQAEDFFRLEPLDTEGQFFQAGRLSHRYALETGVRYLDMLHVASALQLKSGRFLSFDLRQIKLAQAAGLNVRF